MVEDHRDRLARVRPVDIRPQHDAVVHRDGEVALDQHLVLSPLP
jgi:hypothetical protein